MASLANESARVFIRIHVMLAILNRLSKADINDM